MTKKPHIVICKHSAHRPGHTWHYVAENTHAMDTPLGVLVQGEDGLVHIDGLCVVHRWSIRRHHDGTVVEPECRLGQTGDLGRAGRSPFDWRRANEQLPVPTVEQVEARLARAEPATIDELQAAHGEIERLRGIIKRAIAASNNYAHVNDSMQDMLRVLGEAEVHDGQ